MCQDYLLADVQSKSCTGHCFFAAHPIETLENKGQRFFRDARAVIDESKQLHYHPPGSTNNDRQLGRVFDRIIKDYRNTCASRTPSLRQWDRVKPHAMSRSL
jgi:hypothetical protein